MKKAGRLLFSGWGLRTIGAIALALVIWFAGPLIAIAEYHPLDPAWARIALIVVLIGCWFARQLVSQFRLKRKNGKLFDAIAPPSDKEAQSAVSAEIRERFEKAVTLLKTTSLANRSSGKLARLLPFGGRRYVYQLPWFIFVGAPGSGKTTALLHSGLQFPLAQSLGHDPVHGIGGTRNCDWWFTDQAVLIDTAGRYTTQDSDAAEDAAQWETFLRLLKRFRPRQPINGVLVTVSVSDLLQGNLSEAQLPAQATAVRARISELQRQLGNRFPVYLLVTKSDLLPGFAQFFGDLDREQREQVWGCTFDLERSPERLDVRDCLAPELDALEQRLFEQVLCRMQSARDNAMRALIYGFPDQWVLLKQALLSFASAAFGDSRLTEPVWLRGIYFTSGTQEGTPIDRVLGALARAFGVERRILPPQKSAGRSYFLTRLLRDVVLAESDLAGTSSAEERRLRNLKWTGMAAVSLVLLASLSLWTISYVNNTAYLDEVAANVTRLKSAFARQSISSDDFGALNTALNSARGIAQTAHVAPSDPPVLLTGGLFQGGKLQAGAEQVYGRLLAQNFAPLLSHRIETVLRQQNGNPELQYETLKAYLMLYRRDKLDIDQLKAWVAFDLETNFSHALPADARGAVLDHVQALLSKDTLQPAAAIDQALIDNVREKQLQSPFVQRVYGRIKRQSPDTEFKDFRIADAGGPNSQLVFTFKSGRPLSSGVPGLFSYNGYHKGFERQLKLVLTQLAQEEVWVLGVKDSDNARRASDPRTFPALANEVRRLYLQDYATTWERFIADVTLVRTTSLAQSIDQARMLSSSDSPLPRLLRSIVREVTLGARESPAKRASDKVADAVGEAKAKLGLLLGSDAPAPRDAAENGPIEAIVDDRFAALRRLTQNPAPNQPAPIEATLSLINDLYSLMTATDSAVKAGATPPPSEVPNKVRSEAGRLPEPLRSMLNNLASSGTNQALLRTRANLSERLATSVGEPCEKAFAGRYPFAPGSRKDVLPDDFVRLLAQNGILDEFFQKYLAAYVDTTSKPWKFRNFDDASMGDISDALMQFQRAEEIRRAFFSAGSNMPSIRMTFKPVGMDASIAQFNLDVDGQLISYAHGAGIPTTVQWPGPRGGTQVYVQVRTAEGNEVSQTYEGPWALFRMFDAAQVVRTAQPERLRTTFSVGGKKAHFEVSSSSVQNPYRLAALQAFRCPGKL